jgi:CRP-like cAMP-binding protein
MIEEQKILDDAKSTIENLAVFGDLLTPEEKEYLLDHGRVRHAAPGETLCTRHQLDSRVYIIVMGEVEIFDTKNETPQRIARLGKGEICGEISALFKVPRISNAIVSMPSVLIEIPGEALEKIISARKELYQAIVTLYKSRITDTALRAVPIFKQLSDEQRSRLIEESSLMGFKAGTTIVHEKEPGDSFYIMVYGTAQVTSYEQGKTKNVANLKVGDYFGEWSLLTGAPRMASVIAESRVDVIHVDYSLFLDLIQGNPDLRERLDQVAHNRLETAHHPQAN